MNATQEFPSFRQSADLLNISSQRIINFFLTQSDEIQNYLKKNAAPLKVYHLFATALIDGSIVVSQLTAEEMRYFIAGQAEVSTYVNRSLKQDDITQTVPNEFLWKDLEHVYSQLQKQFEPESNDALKISDALFNLNKFRKTDILTNTEFYPTEIKNEQRLCEFFITGEALKIPVEQFIDEDIDNPLVAEALKKSLEIPTGSIQFHASQYDIIRPWLMDVPDLTQYQNYQPSDYVYLNSLLILHEDSFRLNLFFDPAPYEEHLQPHGIVAPSPGGEQSGYEIEHVLDEDENEAVSLISYTTHHILNASS